MSRSRAPVPAPQAPLPTALLTGPRAFAQALAQTEAAPWRYVGAVLLSAALSGAAYAALVRPAVNLAAQLSGGPAPLAVHLTNVIGGAFLTLFTFGLMWGLGWLGAGRAGRPAEVYGATFALLPPLLVLVTVLALLTPPDSWMPSAAALAAAGKNDRAVQLLALGGIARTPAAFLLLIVTVLGTAAQCGLSVLPLRVLTGSPLRAALGALLPLLPAVAVGFIGLAPLLFSQ